MSYPDPDAQALHGIATKAIDKVGKVLKAYTQQLKLIEAECRELNQRCSDAEQKWESAQHQLGTLRERLCRCHEHGDTDAERWESRAAYASGHNWHDLAEYYTKQAEACRKKEVTT